MNALYSSRLPKLCCVLATLALGLILTCTTGPPVTEAGRETAPQVKVPVEAYLFDVSIRRHGKPTSLRLDVFDADSVIALGGRAYLGKGALRGRMTRDSLVAYFPTSDEYLLEDFSSFSIGGANPTDLSEVGFLNLLKQPPDTGVLGDSIRADCTHSDDGDSKWIIHPGTLEHADSLRWRLHLTYALTEEQMRLAQFAYYDSTTTITANRREYRSRARVPADRFGVAIPPSAVRVTP